jgi:hypothetical protein
MKKRICSPQICGSALLLAVLVVLSGAPTLAQSVPPTSPTGLTATAASCGQVNLSWSAATDNSGTGLKAYSIWRNDSGVNTVTSIGATRTWFDDTMYVKSATTMSYYVVALDNAGNQSQPSNPVTVNTPGCPLSVGEQVVDAADTGPLGNKMATYGTVTALLYTKLNLSQRETWIYVTDSSTGQSSFFRLHPYPGYSQIETDYVLMSATQLWAISNDMSSGGHLLVSQYQLNGPPPTSATLVSTQALGDSYSTGQSLIRLQSGGMMVAWDEQPLGSSDLTTGFAYRNPTGIWAVHFPVTIPNDSLGGSITKSRIAQAQHPADGSIWVFVKRDSFPNIMSLHFTEGASDVALDSTNETLILGPNCSYVGQPCYNDGNNGPNVEFPFLTASPDSTRNAILLAYQDLQYQVVFIDPLYGNLQNNIFLKQAPVTVAQIGADGSKNFIPSPNYAERVSQFGMSVLSDGTIWLAYQPIDSTTYTWNKVYASKYQNGVWSVPVLAGLDYNDYNSNDGLNNDPSIVYRIDQPQVAFRTPDQEIHTLDLSNLGAAPTDTAAPTTSITSPANGATVSGSVTISASASDNVGVTKVDLLVDGSVAGTMTSSPYVLLWDTTRSPNGTHTLQTKAYDAAGNAGLSAIVSVNVNNAISSANLTVSITNPTNGSTVPRNQNVTVSAAATDTVAVTKMQFYVNNNLLCTTTTAPYKCGWKVPGKKASYNIQAKGYDAMGNSAAQAITVTAQ